MTAQPSAQEAVLFFQRRAHRRATLIGLTMAVLLGAFVLDVLTGPSMIGVGEILEALLMPGAHKGIAGVIVWTLRLPMATMAIVVGMALGVAGAQSQAVLDNPLADPYTLGLSAAAGFGAAAAITFASRLPIDTIYMAPICAILGCAAASGIVYAIARWRGAHTQTMALAGIATMFLFQALLTLVQYQASPEVLQSIMFWLFGSLARASWSKVAIVSAVLAVACPILLRDAWRLTALSLGDERARALGVRVEAVRIRTFALISIFVAASVCFVGTIGFVGLVAPHIARKLVGDDHRYLLPLSALVGAVLLSSASVASKSIVPGAVYPLGIVTALVGVPFLFLLILKQGNEAP